ncbi:unnamed protein product [Camellia sinensis]
MTHKGERIDKMSLWKRAHNLNDPDVVAIVRNTMRIFGKFLRSNIRLSIVMGFTIKLLRMMDMGIARLMGEECPGVRCMREVGPIPIINNPFIY